MSVDRLAQARDLLEREGVEAAISAAGESGDILAVRVHVAERPRLARLAPGIRALGFRYVAIELVDGP